MNTINTEKDKQVWNSSKVIQKYATFDELQKGEQAIIDLLKDRLPGMRMLDLGIGGGRTTVHFEPLVYEYLGSDYAENMVMACRARFKEAGHRTRFEVLDAVNMSMLPESYYDFILFSFNGIDGILLENRDKVFQEVRRVGKPGGYFAFSTHNINFIPQLYRLKWRNDWREFLYQFYRLPLLYWYNGTPGQYRHQPVALFRNGVEHFALSYHYVLPEYQVAHLKDLGFKNIRVFSHKTGNELTGHQLATFNQDAWLYYLCEI
jgi:ubiquinone/menaquinone biosynthesis C-methylase UbiE